jgi:hypothetical protein
VEGEFVWAMTVPAATETTIAKKVTELRNNFTGQIIGHFIMCIIIIIGFPCGEPFRREENTSVAVNVQQFAIP